MLSATEPFGYVGKRVIVSGCFSGIGSAAARLLRDAGAQVHGFDVKPSDQPLTTFARVDLRDPESIDAAIAALRGPFDALFNCAGIAPGGSPLDVMKVNFLGTRHFTDRVLPMMAAGSAIVNVASNGGMGWLAHLPELRELADAKTFGAGADWCASHPVLVGEGYRLSKEAIIVWTMTSATRLIKRGVRMNCTLPGAVQTPMLEEIEKTTPSALIDSVAQPIGRRSSADEQAMALLFLNSGGASYVNGAALPVDGGFMASRVVGE